MIKTGNIQKMHTSLASDNAIYQMPIGNNLVLMNELIGQEISLTFNSKSCLTGKNSSIVSFIRLR
jgi:hypothetical protein